MRWLLLLFLALAAPLSGAPREVRFRIMPGGATVAVVGGQTLTQKPAAISAYALRLDDGKIHSVSVERAPFDPLHFTLEWVPSLERWRLRGLGPDRMLRPDERLDLSRTVRLDISPGGWRAWRHDPVEAGGEPLSINGTTVRVAPLATNGPGVVVPAAWKPPPLFITRPGFETRIIEIGEGELGAEGDAYPPGGVALRPLYGPFSYWQFNVVFTGALGGLGLWGWRRRGARVRGGQTAVAEGLLVPEPQESRIIGDFRVVRKLGEGGQAEVFLAEPTEASVHSEAVAIKILREGLGGDSEFRRRFEREVKTCCMLSHPGVLRILDWGEDEGRLYMVTELIEGHTLAQMMTLNDLSQEAALAFLDAIIEAMAYAHGRGIVHRDLKPSNIMITAQGRVKIMDFGLATGQQFTQVTESGGMHGTVAYIAPERLEDYRCLDPRVDQYAIGLIAYRMLVGRLPFDTAYDDTGAIFSQHLAGGLPPPSVHCPTIPPAVDRVIARMYTRDPQARFPTLDEALAALRACDLAPPAVDDDLPTSRLQVRPPDVPS